MKTNKNQVMYEKYKDASPQETIEMIKNILSETGIRTCDQVKSEISGLYSGAVVDLDFGWKTSGKGTSEDYCLASAYGEAIEHLCSYFSYDENAITDEAKHYLGFTRYPDERIELIEDIPLLAPEVFDDMMASFKNKCGLQPDRREVINLWEELLESKTTTFAPYFSVKTQNIKYLPERIISLLCGSNGGGAGNTPQEAIGHGLDEACERFVKHEIYSKNLTPPNVPREFIQRKYPELSQLIFEIEERFHMKAIVKDASLGKGFPVLGLLLVDEDNQTYIVNFGSHPVFHIALERCLTEMFQFYLPTVSDYSHKSLVRWRAVSEDHVYSNENWVSLLRDDTGIIPDSFFLSSSTWEFVPWKEYSDYNNKIGMNAQIDTILKITKDIYIRDVSCLGFPTFRTYCPGFTTSFINYSQELLESIKISNLCARFIQNEEYDKIDQEIRSKLCAYSMDHEFYSADRFLGIINNELVEGFRAALYYDAAEFDKAMALLKKADNRFCDAVLKEFYMKRNGLSEKNRNDLIAMFYGQEKLHFVKCWREKSVFVSLLKWKTEYTNHPNLIIRSKDMSELHKRIKKQMIRYRCDQMKIVSYINLNI